MDRKDLLDIIQSVQEGKQLSDFVVVAIHVSSFAFQAYSHDNSTPDFLVELAHAAGGENNGFGLEEYELARFAPVAKGARDPIAVL